ncbi:MAG: sigma-70 family RNA polymerase sigma factor [Oscillospiraceae bacterium]|nr:sigma-70 family RNA polymerase sigma factor [Oscillospiraceae bacterium]
MLALFLSINDKIARTKLERLHARYSRLMLSVAYKILNDSYLAEDAVQQSFEKIIKNLHKIDEKNVLTTRNFVVIICRNVSLNFYRDKCDNQSGDIDDVNIESAEPSPANIVIDNESVEKIVNAIEKLPLIYRDVLSLRISGEYSAKEIAQILDISVETVNKRLFRARKTLAKSLERGGDNG